MQARYVRGHQDMVHFTAAANIEAGEVLNLGSGLVGVALRAFLNGEAAAACVSGTFAIAKASATTGNRGAAVDFNQTSNLVVADAAGDHALGVLAEAAVDGKTEVNVLINFTRGHI